MIAPDENLGVGDDVALDNEGEATVKAHDRSRAARHAGAARNKHTIQVHVVDAVDVGHIEDRVGIESMVVLTVFLEHEMEATMIENGGIQC